MRMMIKTSRVPRISDLVKGDVAGGSCERCPRARNALGISYCTRSTTLLLSCSDCGYRKKARVVKALDFPCGAFGGENSCAFIPAAIEAKALGARTSTVRASEWCST